MERKDLDLLVKLLSLTTSSVDAEALNAIRKANELLKRQSATWSDIVVGMFNYREKSSVRGPQRSDGDFGKVVEAARGVFHESFDNFLNDAMRKAGMGTRPRRRRRSPR